MRVCVIVTVVLAAIGVTMAVAQDPATNKPAQQTFRTPLVRDIELLDQVKALTARVAALEAKNAEMAKKMADLETKLAAARR
jgi:hypothetical protein